MKRTRKKLERLFLFLLLAGSILLVLEKTLFRFFNPPVALSEPYQRKKHFGSWQDIDRDGMNSRHNLLLDNSIAQDTEIISKRGQKFVGEGLWIDYLGDNLIYHSKNATIDHLISLKEAWLSGACKWSPSKRQLFFNSPIKGQLVVTKGAINQSKSSHDVSRWMPHNPNQTEDFLNNWIAIKKHWGLSVDTKEWKTLKLFLGEEPLKSLPITPASSSECR